MGKAIGFDFGSSCTAYCVQDENEIKMLPSVVAVNQKTGQLLAIGNEARKMIGRAPSSINVIRPIKGGIVTDVSGAATIVNDVLEKLELTSVFKKAAIYATTPFGISKSNENMLAAAIAEAGTASLDFVDTPLAIALGAGMPPDNPRSNLIVDVGAGHVNASVISHGGIVISSSTETAGDAMTAAIVSYIAAEHGIAVGELTAELIKVKLGTLNPDSPKKSLKISGKVIADKNSKHGGKITATEVITSHELIHVLTPFADKIIETITGALKNTPPEISSDIFDLGIILSGGGASLDGITKYIKVALGIKVASTKTPAQDAAKGLARIIAGGKAYAKFTR